MNPDLKILQGLNNKQLESVSLDVNTNALILAGAGSGKTRVLTHRIAYLIQEKNIPLESILAVTFTNKAAGEMRDRLSLILRRPIPNMWVGTFHGLAHRLLRLHHDKANLSSQFQILDSQDQFRIIKRLMKENQVDESKYPVKQIQWFINSQKDEGLRPQDIDPGYNFFIKKSVEIYTLYEAHCQRNDLIDFAELLLRSYELLKNNEDLLNHFKSRFSHILIDEFQDTNKIQYNWIKQLYSGSNHLFCVGDDDQSIYGWRGARVENIQKLETDFNPLKTIRLEQNYRSTGTILSASNQLISNNSDRLGKSLWTDSGDGEMIDVYEARDEINEAEYVTSKIKALVSADANYSDCAILYRSNAQSRAFEEVLIKHNLPYVIYGGLRFFERAEIKDAMCYLRLSHAKNDDVAFERIVNFPPRGIGNSTLQKIREYAQQNLTSLYIAAKEIQPDLSTRASNSIKSFVEQMESIDDDIKHLNLSEKVAKILALSGLMNYYENDKSDKAGSKKDNLEELIAAAKNYLHEDEEIDEITGFISLATLESSVESNHNPQQNIQLMTIHSAKGLEFENVFLVGMEEDLFPTNRSKEESHLLSEERRLCYVGMTRARKKLTLTHAIKRFIHGQSIYAYPSRFLSEIPDQHLNWINENQHSLQSQFSNSPVKSIVPESTSQLAIGASVRHAKFGMGTVTNFEGSGDSQRVQVNFQSAGSKWLILSYANLDFI